MSLTIMATLATYIDHVNWANIRLRFFSGDPRHMSLTILAIFTIS
jgi:hypothetical protein